MVCLFLGNLAVLSSVYRLVRIIQQIRFKLANSFSRMCKLQTRLKPPEISRGSMVAQSNSKNALGSLEQLV